MADAGDCRRRKINAMELRIDDECSRILARRQPAASDLRLVLSVAKCTTDLERIGDEATKIARQAVKLWRSCRLHRVNYTELRQIGRHVASMLREALDAFARLDVERAIDVVVDDGNVDAEYDSAMRSLVTFMMEDARNIRQRTARDVGAARPRAHRRPRNQYRRAGGIPGARPGCAAHGARRPARCDRRGERRAPGREPSLLERAAALTPYVPGEQPRGETLLKLNTNESAYPPSPRVLEAVRGIGDDEILRYPDPTSRRLREAAAVAYGVSPTRCSWATVPTRCSRTLCGVSRGASAGLPGHHLQLLSGLEPALRRAQHLRAPARGFPSPSRITPPARVQFSSQPECTHGHGAAARRS
jgi:hypothetical protein